MPWTQVTGLGNNTFEGATAEEHFVRNSALLLTLRDAMAGDHRLISAIEERENGEFLVDLNFVTTNTPGIAPSYVTAGTKAWWSTNATDENASSSDLTPSGRGRRIRYGRVDRVSGTRLVIVLETNDGRPLHASEMPSVGDVIFFKR